MRHGWGWSWALRLYVAVMVTVMIAPIAVVLLISLNPQPFLRFPPSGLSLRWFWQAAGDDDWSNALATSLQVGAIVTCLSLLLGVSAAFGLRAATGRIATAVQTFIVSPLMIPSLVIGLAILRFYTSLNVTASSLSVALAQTILATPYVVRFVLASLAGVDPAVERAARILGAGVSRTFVKVTFPLIRHGIIAGGLFSFIVSLDDVNVAMFLSDIHVSPLSVQLLGYVQQSADPLGAAVASTLVIIAFGLILLCDRIAGLDWLFGIRTVSRP